MCPDARQRAAKVREKADVFKTQGYRSTGDLLFRLAEGIETGNKTRCDEVWINILPTFRDEYVRTDPVFGRLYDFIESILINSIDALKEDFNNKMLELSPLLAAMGKAADVMGELLSLFLKGSLDNKQRFYAACLLYAIDVEGQFDQSCRVIYVLNKVSQGLVIPLSGIENLSLWKIREELKISSHGESEVLFLGWEDNHLRNAIFHMRIQYDKLSDEMRFEDYAVSKGKLTYDEKWTYNEFSRFIHLINGVSFVFLNIMMILTTLYDMASLQRSRGGGTRN